MTDTTSEPTPNNDNLPDRADVVVPPPVLWVLLVAVGYGLEQVLPLRIMPSGLPAGWIGFAMWLAGFALAAMAIVQFRRAGTDVQTHTSTAVVVDTGVFAKTRNPIYVGAHIGIIGAALGFDSLWIMAMLIPFFLIIHYGVVAREEAYLERKFGEPYLAYKARVRRWI